MSTVIDPEEWSETHGSPHLWLQYISPLLEREELHALSQTNRWFKSLFNQESTWQFLLTYRLPKSMRRKDEKQTYRQFYMTMCSLKPHDSTWAQYDYELDISLDGCSDFDYNGDQLWKVNDQWHRIGDLPARISIYGDKNGIRMDNSIAMETNLPLFFRMEHKSGFNMDYSIVTETNHPLSTRMTDWCGINMDNNTVMEINQQ